MGMSRLRWFIPRCGRGVTEVALLLTAAIRFGEVAAAGHGDCHDAADETCPICLYAHSPSSEPDTTLPPPTPTIEQRVVLPPVLPRGIEPLFAIAPRGPPDRLL